MKKALYLLALSVFVVALALFLRQSPPEIQPAPEVLFGTSGDVIFSDTFTEASSNTNLTSHTPDVGTSWTAVDTRTATIQAKSATDVAQPSADAGSQGQTVMADATYPSANYQVKFKANAIQNTNDDYSRVYARYTAQAANGYYSFPVSSYTSEDPTIYKGASASTETDLLASFGKYDNSLGSWYTANDILRFEVIGSDIAIFGGQNGEEVARTYISDSSVTSAGRAGFGFGASWALTGGDTVASLQNIDDFSVVAVGGTVSSWFSPATTGETDNSFTNPTNAYSSDNSRTTVNFDVGVGTYDQDYGDFNISCTGGNTITGISVRIESLTDFSGYNDWAVAVSDDNGSTWSTEKTVRIEDMDAVDGNVLLGHAASLWGKSWTCTTLDNDHFRVKIRASARESTSVDTTAIDHVSVRLITDGGGGGGGGGDTGAVDSTVWFTED